MVTRPPGRARRARDRVSQAAEPSPWRRPAVAAPRQLVDVVEQGRRLHEPRDPRRCPGRPLAPRATPRPPRRRARGAGTTPAAPASAAGGRPRGDRGWSWPRSYPVGTAQSPEPGSPAATGASAGAAATYGERRAGRDRDGARERGRAGASDRAATRAMRGDAAARASVRRDARRGPVVRTVRPDSASSTVTEPSWSVRSVRAPAARSRASVAGAGWPYVLPAPADATATRGRTASTKACVVAVRLPWWATLSRSTRGRPRASSAGSMPSSTSPARRNRRPLASPSSTTETLLIAVPVSGGSRWDARPDRATGPASRSRRGGGARRSPSTPCGGPSREDRAPGRPARARSAHPGLVHAADARSARGCAPGRRRGPRAGGSARRRPGGGPTAGSARRGRRGRGSGRGRRRRASGRRVRVSRRIASPCPTSSTVIRVARARRLADGAAPASATTIAPATSAARPAGVTGTRSPRRGRRAGAAGRRSARRARRRSRRIPPGAARSAPRSDRRPRGASPPAAA